MIFKSELKFEVIPIGLVTRSQKEAWIRLLREWHGEDCPHFYPGFFYLMAEFFDSIYVGFVYHNDEIVGIFPFENLGSGHAAPVGRSYCDYQALIMQQNLNWDPATLLHGFKIKKWNFDHLLANHPQWASMNANMDVSWLIGLENGVTAYKEIIASRGGEVFSFVRNRKRQLERDLGPVAFNATSANVDAIEQLIEWKEFHRISVDKMDKYNDWEKKLLKRLVRYNDGGFSGIFSTLEAGNKLLAAHIGFRSPSVWHYDTTSYNRNFSKYSPGIVMLAEMIESTEKLGIKVIDLGKENYQYKRRFYTHTIPLLEGQFIV